MRSVILRVRSVFAVAAAVALLPALAQAQVNSPLYWDTTSTADWGSTADWWTTALGTSNPASVPGSSNDAVFDGTGIDGGETVTLSAPQAAMGLYFVNAGSTSLVGTGTDTTLTLGTDGISIAPSAGAVTLGNGTAGYNVLIDLAGGSQTWTNISAGNFTINDTVAAFTRSAFATLDFNQAASGVFSMSTTVLPNSSTGIIGPWATFGIGTSTAYAYNNAGTIAGIAGTAAATAANVTDTTGAVNYTVAAVGTLGSGANFNTLRYTGGAGTIAGTWTANGLMNTSTGYGLLTMSGAGTIGSSNELVVDTANGGITLSGGIGNNGSNPSSLTVTGPNTVTLSGTDTYTGGTTINAGTVLAVAAVNLPTSGTLSIGPNGTFSMVNGAAVTTYVTNQLSLASGSAMAFDWQAGAVDEITSTTAATAAGNVLISINPSNPTGNLTLISSPNGGLNTATYLLANNSNYTATLSSSGTALTITSYATATALTAEYWKGGLLSAAPNVWAVSTGNAGGTSNWTSDAGGNNTTPLVPGSSAAVTIGATGAADLGSMVLGANMTIASLTFASNATLNADGNVLTVPGGTFTVNNGVTATIGASLTANSGAFNMNGPGTLILTGFNARSASNNSPEVGIFAASTVNSGTLELAGPNSGSATNTLTVKGGTLDLAAPAAAGASVATSYFGGGVGNIGLGGGTASSASIVLDSYGFYSGNRTYTGSLSISSSQLTPFTVYVTEGTNISGTATFVGSGGFSDFGFGYVFDVAANCQLTLGAYGGNPYGFTKADSGILALTTKTAVSNLPYVYSPFTVSGGTLELAGANALDSGSNVPIAIGGAGTLDIEVSESFFGLSGSGTLTNNSSTTSTTFTDWGGLFSGTIANGSGGKTLALSKTGIQTLELSGTNTYTGGTTVNGGLLQFDSAASLPTSGTITVNVGGAVAVVGTDPQTLLTNSLFSFSGGGAIALTAPYANESISMGSSSASLGAATNLTYGGTLTPNGTTYRLGGGAGVLTYGAPIASGSLIVGGNVALTASNSFSGGTTINAGTLQISAADNLGNGSLTFGLNSGGTSGGYLLEPVLDTGANSFSLTQNVLIAQYSIATFQESAGGTLTVGNLSEASNSGYLVKQGAGTLDLDGTVPTSNALLTVTVANGTLQYDNSAGTLSAASGTGPVLTMSGGTLSVLGNSSTATHVSFNGLSFTGFIGGGVISVNANGGSSTLLSLGGASTSKSANIDFVLPAGTQSATNGITTTSGVTNNLLGGVDTVNGWTDFASDTAATAGTSPYNIVPLNAANTTAASSWTSTSASYSFNGGSQMLAGNASAETLRFTGSGPVTINLNTHTFTEAIGFLNDSGSLVTISNGTIGAGVNGYNYFGLGGPLGSDFSISAAVASSIVNAVVKFGPDTVTFSNTNAYTSGTYIDGGTLSISANANLGEVTASNGVPPAVYLNGGTLQATATFSLDNSGASTATNGFQSRAIVLLSGGGTIDVTGTNNLTVSGPIANQSNPSGAIGTFDYNGIGNLTKIDSGTLTLTGANSYTGTTTLAGGTLNVGVAEVPNVSGPLGIGGTIIFSGGTLQYSAANQTDYSSRFSTAAGQAYNVDTNGQSITWATRLASSGGSLTVKDSNGTPGSLTLNAAATYSGPTTINSGTLRAGGANFLSPNSDVTINGGTLDATSGNQTIQSLTMTSAGTLSLSPNYMLTATNASTVTGTLDLSALVTAPAELISFPNGYTGTFSATNLPPSESLEYLSNQIDVINGITWGGQNGSAWDISTTNWFTGSSGTQFTNTPPVAVFFKDSQYADGPPVANNSSISISLTGGVSPLSVTFDNNSVPYTITSSDTSQLGITGSTGITLDGTKPVTLVGPNTYTGTTLLGAGSTLVISDNDSLGSTVSPIAALTIDGGTLQYATGLTANSPSSDISGRVVTIGSGGATIDINGNSVTLAQSIGNGGGSALTVASTSGGGVLTLQGANTFTGLNLNGGTVNFSSLGNLGNASIVSLNGGTLQWATGVGSVDVSSGGYSLSMGSAGGTLDINGNSVRLAGGVGFTGAGGLSVKSTAAPATLTLAGTSTYTGTTTVYSSASLQVVGTLASSMVTVNSGAALGGSGTITNDVSVAAGGIVSPSLGGTATTLNVGGNLALAANAVLDFTLSSLPDNDTFPPEMSNDHVAVGGNLTLAGGTINITGSVVAGYYELMSYTGTAPDASNWSVTGPGGFTYTLADTYTDQFDLHVTSNGGSSTWIYAGSGSNYNNPANWDNGIIPNDAGHTASSASGDPSGSLTSPTMITVDNDLNPTLGTLTFDNSNVSYTLNNGTLTLDSGNSTGGAVNVVSGSHQINSTLILADGSQSTTFTIAAGSTLGMGGAIDDSMSVATQAITLTGGGELALYSSDSTYSGGTTVNNGSLVVGEVANIGAGGLKIDGSGASATFLTSSGQNVPIAGSLEIDNGGTLNMSSDDSTGIVTVSGPPILNSGAINVNSGTLVFNNTVPASGTGAVTVTVQSSATLELAGSASALTSAVTVINHGSLASTPAGGLLVTGGSQTVGVITGIGTLVNSATTYDGDTVVSGGANLTATQILQNTLTINAGSTVTIAPAGSEIEAQPAAQASATDAATLTRSVSEDDSSDATSSSDPFTAIQAAIASGSITSAAGQRLESRIAAIESLAANDPGLSASVLENRVLAVLPLSTSSLADSAPPAVASSSLLALDSSEIGSSGSASGSAAAAFAPSASFSGSPAAVPEPSALFLALLAGLGAAFGFRRRASARIRGIVLR